MVHYYEYKKIFFNIGVSLFLIVLLFTVGIFKFNSVDYGELLIKIGDGDGYENGDIVQALNSKSILNTNLQQIVHPKSMLRTNNRINQGTVLETYLENTKEYKFERVSKKKIKRINLWTQEVEIISNISNIKGEYMDVQRYVERRLRLKPDQNKIFGGIGDEYWYGGGTKITKNGLKKIWDDVETKTLYKKNDYKTFPFTDKELSIFYVVRVNDFTDDEAGELTAPKLDKNKKIIKQRKNKVDFSKLELTKKELSNIINKKIKVDTRKLINFKVSDIVKIK